MNLTNDTENVYEILPFLHNKMLENSRVIANNFPHYTENAKYTYRNDGFWTSGFWPGLNLLAYQYYKNTIFLETLESCFEHLENLLIQENILDHDIGFIYIPTFLGHYKLTGNENSKRIALTAARMLKERFNRKGKFIRAWNDWDDDTPDFREEKKGKVIIDSLMNIPLLFWAYEETNELDFYVVAKEHAETVMTYLVRDDYSTYHTFNFDPKTGVPLAGRTQQGFSDESCWSRGQAWGIYGFALVYQYTQEKKFLDASMKLADYFINRLPEDNVPVWDFDAKDSKSVKDSSSAAIASSGLLLISTLLEDENNQYYSNAITILESLKSDYLSCDLSFDALLNQGCSDLPRGAGINSGIIYGDYFFFEALLKLKNINSFFER
ncbi:glycoside hydrolase family 88 protein [Metabacillus sp. SLBN-84]